MINLARITKLIIDKMIGANLMKVIPTAEAKINFGALLDSAQREPVTISKIGRRVAAMMSVQAYEEHEALKLEHLRREVNKGIKQLDKGKSSDGHVFMGGQGHDPCATS